MQNLSGCRNGYLLVSISPTGPKTPQIVVAGGPSISAVLADGCEGGLEFSEVIETHRLPSPPDLPSDRVACPTLTDRDGKAERKQGSQHPIIPKTS
jgi:hypothetical protein